MSEGRIWYIGFFDYRRNKARDRRNFSAAAGEKIRVITDMLCRLGLKVELVSAAGGISERFFVAKGERVVVGENVRARYFPTVGGGNILCRVARKALSGSSLLSLLLFKVRRDDCVLLYHWPGFSKVIRFMRRLRKFRLILEVEELYQDAVPMSAKECEAEWRLLGAANAIICSTKQLNDVVNTARKPHAVIHGQYSAEPKISTPPDDGRIHVVYSGTFDPTKGGAYAAIEAVPYLTDEYCLHISGFGTPEEVVGVTKIIAEMQVRFPGRIEYHGRLDGRDYRSLLQSCRIGLSTQNPSEKFNGTSFPSKVLSYMTNGLVVVSTDVKVVRESALGTLITFCDECTGPSIADAIMRAAATPDASERTARTLRALDADAADALRTVFLMRDSM
ncbi:MAG: glycosyltransferase [Muribaculaceae bacterium]